MAKASAPRVFLPIQRLQRATAPGRSGKLRRRRSAGDREANPPPVPIEFVNPEVRLAFLRAIGKCHAKGFGVRARVHRDLSPIRRPHSDRSKTVALNHDFGPRIGVRSGHQPFHLQEHHVPLALKFFQFLVHLPLHAPSLPIRLPVCRPHLTPKLARFSLAVLLRPLCPPCLRGELPSLSVSVLAFAPPPTSDSSCLPHPVSLHCCYPSWGRGKHPHRWPSGCPAGSSARVEPDHRDCQSEGRRR